MSTAKERLQKKAAERAEARAMERDPEIEKKADEVCHNLPGVEAAWAVVAGQFAEDHERFLRSVPRNATPQRVRLTSLDSDIYTKFRLMFPAETLSVAVLDEDELKSPAMKAKWRPFCMHYEKTVEDYNTGTILRLDASKPYSPENTTLAPRIQFYAIEIARLREGCNVEVMGPEREGAENEEFFLRVCVVCGKEAPYRCARCKSTRYCSKECQTKDWAEHKKTCGRR